MVALTEVDVVVQTPDIHLFNLARGIDSRLTSDPALDANARWSPDGAQMVFSSSRDGYAPEPLYQGRLSGGAREERLFTSDAVQHRSDRLVSATVVPIVFAMLDPEDEMGLVGAPDRRLMQRPDPNEVPTPYLRTEFNEHHGRLSLDGRWMAYASDESGNSRSIVREFPLGDRAPRKSQPTEASGPCGAMMEKSSFTSLRDRMLIAVPVKP